MAGRKPVAGEQTEQMLGIDNKLFEIARQIRQPNFDNFDALNRDLQLVVERIFSVDLPTFKTDFTDFAQRGLKVVNGKEGPLHPKGVTVADLELKKFLYRDEKYISGKAFQKRARDLDANLGLYTAEYLLEHQSEIPKDWRGKYLVFSGTELQRSDGDYFVPYLSWNGKRWYLYFYWLGIRFSSDGRLVRVSK